MWNVPKLYRGRFPEPQVARKQAPMAIISGSAERRLRDLKA